MKIGIVRALYHTDYTKQMLHVAEAEAEKLGISVEHVIEVPGAHDVAVAVKKLMEDDEIQGVVTLGIVIKGGTDHDDVIMYNVSKQLMELACKYEKPIGFGIMGPNISWAQAEQRIEPYAKQAVDAVYDTHNAFKKL